MGVRTWLDERRLSPASDEDARVAAREAAYNLYSGPGFGALFGATSSFVHGVEIVPELTFRSQKQQSPATTSMNNPLLLGPMWRIAQRIGALPLKTYTMNPTTGERKHDPAHPAYKLLIRPNPALTRPLLVSGTVMSMYQYGRAGWFKARDGSGNVVELWPIPGDVLRPLRDPKKLLGGFVLQVHGERVVLKTEDVVYFRLMLDPTNWTDGMAPLQALGEMSDYSTAAIDASTDFFERQLLGRLWLNTNGKELSPKAQRRLQQQIEVARRDRYGIPVLEDGHTLEQMGAVPDGGELSKAIQLARDVIERTFGMPDASSPNWERLYYGEVIQPVADVIEQELERSLMSEWPDQPAFPEFQFREILAGDPLQRAQLHQTRILTGQETLDEARRDENRPPLPNGQGDRAFVPLNLMPIDANPVGGAQQPEVVLGKNFVVDLPETNKGSDSKGGLGGDEGRNISPSGTPPTVGKKT
jgi:HK97 family phage portal protein